MREVPNNSDTVRLCANCFIDINERYHTAIYCNKCSNKIAHKNRIMARRRYNAKNRESINKKSQIYKQQHPERVRANWQRWYKKSKRKTKRRCQLCGKITLGNHTTMYCKRCKRSFVYTPIPQYVLQKIKTLPQWCLTEDEILWLKLYKQRRRVAKW